jgi:hypothetical protein
MKHGEVEEDGIVATVATNESADLLLAFEQHFHMFVWMLTINVAQLFRWIIDHLMY